MIGDFIYSEKATKFDNFLTLLEGQFISKANCQAVNSSKKRMNEFVFTTMRRVFIRFLEEIENIKKTFRNYLTFNSNAILLIYKFCDFTMFKNSHIVSIINRILRCI